MIAPEEYNFVKHASLAAGAPVWAAGTVGVAGGMIRAVDLNSGHYMKPPHGPNSTQAIALANFTEIVFREYTNHFKIDILHPDFGCLPLGRR